MILFNWLLVFILARFAKEEYYKITCGKAMTIQFTQFNLIRTGFNRQGFFDMTIKQLQKKQTVKRYFNDERSGNLNPKIELRACACGNLPSVYNSSGGFNYYRYYKCNKCNLFATGYHQFPSGVYSAMSNPLEMPTEPKLFVVYDDEHNAEEGWNKFIEKYIETL